MKNRQIQSLGSAIGAEIHGINLAEPLSDADVAMIRATLATYAVVFFRDQELTPEQHIAFAQRFAPVNVNRFFTPVADYPLIAEVRKEPDQTANIGGNWHTDHSYDQVPALGSILYAREVPATGGDTLFASMYAAYDTLSDGLKATLAGMRACHSSRHVFGAASPYGGDRAGRIGNAERATQDAVHSVVIRHPDSGRSALYVNPGFTVRFDGWTAEESQPLLAWLYAHATRPEFTCRFHWRPGSIAFWDNRASWHYALNDYPGQRRYMHRITLEGVALT